ncbi:Ldh family oxidoreductase [Planktotalea sp.]|uniref:Ldh family oxidoreductase n=1 Tax=Planktotalea sp. TaxID=2029877 RepID=UPI0025ED5BB8|nr:Ldh family oxidoreductase [Planktotalea sp.]
MPYISVTEIEAITCKALVAHGAAEWIAAEMAQAVAWAEARNNRICGLYYVESYCQQLVSGRVSGTVDPVVTYPLASRIEVDASNGFAQPAFEKALDQAVAVARETGTVNVAIHRAHTCTALGYFTEKAAQKGMIAIGMTNASPIVAPPGGKIRVIGTNPVSFAVPDGKGGVAMGFDQSTTTVALGRITMAKAAGEHIPEGWAVDIYGQPTTDPEAALKGSLTSLGGMEQGYKGWGFGLMVELLAAGMTGGDASRNVKALKAPEGEPHGLGQFFMLIDPSASPAFYDRLSQVSEATAENTGSRMPGQNKVLNEAVDVPKALWALMQSLSNGPVHSDV